MLVTQSSSVKDLDILVVFVRDSGPPMRPQKPPIIDLGRSYDHLLSNLYFESNSYKKIPCLAMYEYPNYVDESEIHG